MQNRCAEGSSAIISALDMQIDNTCKIVEDITSSINSILERANDLFLLLDRMQKTRLNENTSLLHISHANRKDLLEIIELFPKIKNTEAFANLEDCEGMEEIRLKGSKLAHRTRVFLKSLEAICDKFQSVQAEFIEGKYSSGDSYEE